MAKRIVMAALLALIGLLISVQDTVAGAIKNESVFPVRVSETETVPAILRLPANYTQGDRLPVLLIFGGFESAGQVLDLLPANSKVALASFDYPFSAPRHFEFPKSLKAIPQLKALFPKTVYGIADLVAKLRERPEIDPAKVIVVGASFGGSFAIAAAAQDHKIAGLILVHGFGLIPETLNHVILRSWVPKYGWIAHPLAWGLSHLGWYYLNLPKPETLALRLTSSQSVLMITAAQDSFIPKRSSDSLWEAIHKSQAHSTLLIMPTDHLMPGSDHLIGEIVGHILSWLEQSGTAT